LSIHREEKEEELADNFLMLDCTLNDLCRFEEYTDYIFPEESGMAPNLKILEAAYKWKKQKVGFDEDD
jgi:hypothetical protein